MDKNCIENTLFLGNGFSRIVFEGIPSWENLFEGEKSEIENYTILYEVSLLNSRSEEEEIKRRFRDRINNLVCEKNIKREVNGLENFGKYLKDNKVNNIITTNYDRGIEIILCEMCDYKKREKNNDIVSEEIYSIRTYKEFENREMNHLVKLWKIHGDVDRIKSMTLGFDQYGGALWRLNDYLKGTYSPRQGVICKTPMIDKCRSQEFDGISWVELLFRTNVYIVGLGMDFSEIDIWWLFNKRIRIKNQISQIQNHIFYLYNKLYDNRKDIFEALNAFQIECIGIESDENYINKIFEQVRKVI